MLKHITKNAGTILLLPLLATGAWATDPSSLANNPTKDAAPAPSPTPGGTPKYSEVCKDVANLPDSATQSNANQTQKKQYCDAAKAAQTAADTSKSLVMVYGGVTAVCTAACAVSFTAYAMAYSEYVCMGASVVGAGMDALKTKDFMTAVAGLGGVGVTVAQKTGLFSSGSDAAAKGAESGAKAGNAGAAAAKPVEMAQNGMPAGPGLRAANDLPSAATAPTKNDWGSCLSAATAGAQVFMKNKSATDSEQTAKDNLAKAAQLKNMTDTPTFSTFAPGNANGGSLGSAQAGTEGAGSQGKAGGGAASATDKVASLCAAGAAGNGGAAIQCALASDANVPAFVTSPGFGKNIATATGMNPNDYLNAVKDNPSGALSGLGGAFNADGVATLAAAFKSLENSVGNDPSSVYAGAGGGGGGGGGSAGLPDLGLDKFMAGLMPGMAKEKKDETGVSSAQYGEKLRRLASATPEDRSISLFDRVGHRYNLIRDRLAGR